MKRLPPSHTDTGCQYAPLCLECPHPLCYDDDPAAFLALLHADRPAQAVAMWRDGLSVKAIGKALGVSARTAWRLL